MNIYGDILGILETELHTSGEHRCTTGEESQEQVTVAFTTISTDRCLICITHMSFLCHSGLYATFCPDALGESLGGSAHYRQPVAVPRPGGGGPSIPAMDPAAHMLLKHCRIKWESRIQKFSSTSCDYNLSQAASTSRGSLQATHLQIK